MPPSKRVSLKGRGQDLFFGDEGRPIAPDPSVPPEPAPPQMSVEAPETTPPPPAPPSRSDPGSRSPRPARRGTAPTQVEARPANGIAPTPESSLASTLAPAVIEKIRKTVKDPGREVVYARLTEAEKIRLADVVYALQRQRKKTTDTQVSRIAINYIIEDYETNGERSILASVIERLHA